MRLRTVIVEDEAPSLRRLKALLSEFDEIELISDAKDGPSALTLINTEKPDLAFLDIHLPGFSSFELLEKLSHKPMVIFVTAYDEYAIKAFEENAVDYLLKPTDKTRLSRAIKKVKQLNLSIDENLLHILKSAVSEVKFIERFPVKKGDEILFIPVQDVYWFQADDKYVFLHTATHEFYYNATLKDLEKCLDPKRFVRIHKSYIVAIDKIQKMKRSFASKYKIYMSDQKISSFEISRTYIKNVRELLHL